MYNMAKVDVFCNGVKHSCLSKSLRVVKALDEGGEGEIKQVVF
jgi:hypothetical protein